METFDLQYELEMSEQSYGRNLVAVVTYIFLSPSWRGEETVGELAWEDLLISDPDKDRLPEETDKTSKFRQLLIVQCSRSLIPCVWQGHR